MQKIKIIGMGNKDNYSFVIAKKNKDFFKWLKEILCCEPFHIDPSDIEYIKSFDIKCKEKFKKKKIEDCVDCHENYMGFNDDRIDIFYGRNKVFIVVNTTQGKRLKFMRSLEKNSMWTKPKSNKKVFSYRNSKNKN